MKQKTIIGIIITVMFLFCGLSISNGETGSIYLGLKGKSTSRETGTYEFNHKAVFKIVKNNQGGTVENDDGTVIYCLKGGPGFGSESYDNSVINYTQYFDIKNPDSITGAYRSQLPSDMTTYNELVWVLEHIYNPDNESMDQYLERVGILSGSKFRNGTIPTNEVKDMVEVIEQVAIWYFTNPDGEYHNQYTDALELEVDGQNLTDKYGLDLVDGEIDTIYSYFVEGAINAVTNEGYTYETNTVNPVALNTSLATAKIQENNYIIGPYTLEKNNDTSYTLSATVTNGTSDLSNVQILNQNMQEVTTGSTLGDKINSTIGNNFYISLPINTNVENVKLTISVSTQVTTPIMWTVGENELAINQPVVMIDTVNKNYSSSSEVTLPKPTGSYNLQLLKQDASSKNPLVDAVFNISINNGESAPYKTNSSGIITIDGINITDITSNDTITITEITAPDGYVLNNTPITLTITKAENGGKYVVDTVRVNPNDSNFIEQGSVSVSKDESGINTVNIALLNTKIEDSYNLKIIKQDENDANKKLQGAVFNVNVERVLHDSIEDNSETSRTNNNYTTDANGEINITNPIYGEEEHYRLTITETTPPTGYDSTLTEPIIIDAYTDVQDGKYILGNVTASLEDTNWAFDEKTNTITITITNKKQPFDLALRKYITHINGTEVATSREPQISEDEAQAVADGNATFDDGTTAEKDHIKTPLIVQTGDVVRYTIRIYNEGRIDGYAKEITDYLPEGLELVPTSESDINAKYGWKQDGQKINTTYLADTLIKGTVGATLDYTDVQVECKIVRRASDTNISLKNVAEITEAEDILGGTEDVDSTPNNLTDDQKNNYNPGTSEQGKGYEDDDDYEELIMLPTYFDLSLRKFITGVNDREVTNREPVVDTNPLLNGKTTANYNHTKVPVEVQAGDIVTYTIRVYNEGKVDGYVEKIVDHLPPELEFLPNDELNQQYGWTQTDERTIETDYLRNTLLTAFNGGTELDYAEIQIRCRVKDTAEYLKEITNIAEITEYRNDLDLIDRDNENKVVLPSDEDLPNYRDEEIERGDEYIPGQEDDDDFEKVILKQFDLALRKFITGVNDEEVTSRIPQVDTGHYGETDENGNIITSFTYNHTKDPVRVATHDIVIYTIRIYNEGQISGYAEEIKDDIPEGLIFLPENEINQEYRWVMYDANENVTENANEAVYIRTDYLSKAQETTEGENLIEAYDAETMETPDYRDVQVAFRVTEPNTSDRIIINSAEISDDADENGDEVEDIDSTPDEWIDGEDDQDIEKIYVKYFDLALRKWVSQVILIEDGQEKVKDTGHYAEQDPEPVVRVDLNQNRIDNTIIKFRYQIRITNEGEIAGYATEISDYIPEGLEFNQADNPLWQEVDGKVVTDQLKDTLLQPGESATVEIILTWINDEENMGVMINTAEISEDSDEDGDEVEDIDSTPNNEEEGEDDIDDAPVALTMVTGSAPLYIGLTAGTLAIIAGGVFLIKKYVI